jgi:NAD(P)H-dependent flavin oxidoreductase YrpB (nitropropane dioxygenase family)
MTRLSELVGCALPIQQAGMGGGVVPLELALAVAAAGGLPTLSSSGVAPEQLLSTLDTFAEKTDAAIAVNFLMPFLHDREVVSEVASRARIVEFFYDSPDPSLVAQVRAAGAMTGWQVGSLDEATAAVEAGCDLITVQGVEAGGHVRGDQPLRDLLAQVLEVVGVPVIAAGGISTAGDVRSMLDAGAVGVRVGTRFLAAAESAAHPTYIQRLIEAEAADTVVTQAFGHGWPNAPHRVLRRCVEEAHRHPSETVAELALGEATVAIPSWSSMPPTRDVRGNIEAMAMYAGRSVAGVNGIQSVDEIVSELSSQL